MPLIRPLIVLAALMSLLAACGGRPPLALAAPSAAKGCRVGEYWTGKRCACDASRGYFSPGRNATVCKRCPPGSVVDTATNSSCYTCVAGEYARLGAPACLPCSWEEGYASLKPGAAACQRCRNGTTADAGGAACSPCAPGTFSDVTMYNECRQCAEGFHAPLPGTVACKRCPAGSISSDDRTTCTACPRGTRLTSSPPIDKAVSMREWSCVACPQSTYSATPGSTKCTPCPAGRAFLGHNGTSAANCTVKILVKTMIKVRETIEQLHSSKDLENSTRVIKVTSGQAVTDATTLHNGVSASGITDYQVLALPDGSWAVHVTGWDWEKPVTCKAPRGLLRVKCLYSNETVDYGDIYYPAWWRAGRLVLQQVS